MKLALSLSLALACSSSPATTSSSETGQSTGSTSTWSSTAPNIPGIPLSSLDPLMVGEPYLRLGDPLAVGRDHTGQVWLVAGGNSIGGAADDGTPSTEPRTLAQSLPGGPLLTIFEGGTSIGPVAVGSFGLDAPIVATNPDDALLALFGGQGPQGPQDARAIVPNPEGGSNIPFSPDVLAADVDGDALDELFVGLTDLSISQIRVLQGPATPTWDQTRAVIHGSESHPYFGFVLGDLADWDGDGARELSASSKEEEGRGWLIPADLTGEVLLDDVFTTMIRGVSEGDGGGWRPQAGDANGDGHADLLVSAMLDSRLGSVYLVHGPLGATVQLSDAAATVMGELHGDFCGIDHAFLPDTDGDGADDVAVACRENRRVMLYRGSDLAGTLGHADAAVVYLGGTTLGAGHDLTGDGVPDLAVGAPEDDRAGSGAGAVYVLPGPLL